MDIGCFNRWVLRHLPSTTHYLGIDYWDTAQDWYGTVPDIYGDALALPVKSATADIVLLLDVLEHLETPDTAIAEAARCLKPGGRLILQIPFLYPIHDAPRDYTRLSEFGLRQLLLDHGLPAQTCIAQGHPMETAALLWNIALVKTVLNWARQRNPLALLIVLAPFLCLISNLLGWLTSRLSPQDSFMPISYLVIASKCPND